jgi:hypothetical protein
MRNNYNLEDYFIQTGYYDLLPMAVQLSQDFGFNRHEMIEAICKVADKAATFPPQKNRQAWFATVFKEKLAEARAEILAFRKANHL